MKWWLTKWIRKVDDDENWWRIVERFTHRMAFLDWEFDGIFWYSNWILLVFGGYCGIISRDTVNYSAFSATWLEVMISRVKYPKMALIQVSQSLWFIQTCDTFYFLRMFSDDLWYCMVAWLWHRRADDDLLLWYSFLIIFARVIYEHHWTSTSMFALWNKRGLTIGQRSLYKHFQCFKNRDPDCGNCGNCGEAIDLRSGEQWGNTPCTSALLLGKDIGEM